MAFWSDFTQVFTQIDNYWGLSFFLSIIPLILLYLIKPKATEKTIPSLMFLMKQFHKHKSYSFLRIFMRDILFLLQLILLIILSVAATHPFMETNQYVDAEYVVIVVDISASTQTEQGLTDRFSKIIEEAKAQAKGTVSIIAAQNVPYVLLEHAERGEALEVLSLLEPTEGLSNIGGSMLVAEELLEGKEGKVTVVSDFIHTDAIDPHIAKKTLEAKGQIVEFIDVRKKGDNVGITNLEFFDEEAKITIQNFNNKTVQLDVQLNKERKSIELAPNWVEHLFMKIKPGINSVELRHDDDFKVDNEIKISVPEKQEIDILIITNNEKSFLIPALEAYAEYWNKEASIDVGKPPVMPIIDHDIVVVTEAEEKKIPKAVINKIIKEVKTKGTTLIVVAEKDLKKSAFEKYLPVEIDKYVEETNSVYSDKSISKVTSGISFPRTEAYLTSEAKKGATTMVSLESGSPLITMGPLEEGKVVYVGYIPGKNNFKYDMSYPVFWQQLLDYAIGKETVESLNYRAGEKILFDTETRIKTPSRERKETELDFDEVGVYTIKERKYAVNLLNKVESQINFKQKEEDTTTIAEDNEESKGKRIITKYFLWAFLVFLFFELFYVKFRGDL